MLRCGEALRLDVVGLCLGEPEGRPFWPFGFVAARQPFAAVKDFAMVRMPFAAAKGPVLPRFPFSFFLRFFLKNPQKPIQKK